MAEKDKVTRIKANDDASVKRAPSTSSKASKLSQADKANQLTVSGKTSKASKTAEAAKPKKANTGKKGVFRRIGGYFKGAWVELRQVRWPDRRATWGLTIAVLLFSGFFVLFILALDALFKYLFQLIIA